MFYFENTRKPDFSHIKKIDYDEYWKVRGFELNKGLKEREEIMLKWIPAGSKVADLGCGNSLLPVRLKDKGCYIMVGDISNVVLQGYKKYGIDGKLLDLEKIDTLHFETIFDYVILSEVLEHTKNPEDIIARLTPFVRHFIITVPNSAFYRYRLHLFFSGRFFTQWVYHPSEHIRFWSHIDFLDWLSALSLEVEKLEASNGFSLFGLFPRLKDIWKNLFGHQIAYLVRVKEQNTSEESEQKNIEK